MRCDVVERIFQMHPLVRCGLFDHAGARPPLSGGPDRPRHETAAAVRADIIKPGLDAIRAEGAFVGADPRFQRVRRKVLVAIFAVRPKLQRHGSYPVATPIIANRAHDSKGKFPSIYATPPSSSLRKH